MKTIKLSIFAFLAIFASCEVDDVENRPSVQGQVAPVLSAPEEGNVYVLNPNDLDALAERFVWSAADFGEGIIPNYDVEIDFAGDDFDSPAVIGTTVGTLQLAATNELLNSAIQSLDAIPFEPQDFQVRVKAWVGSEVIYSNPVEINVTPYSTAIPKLWVPGAYQSESGYGNDWTHATAPQLAAREFGDTSFEGYVYVATNQTLTDDGLKFTTQDNWDGTNYGDDGSFSGVLSPTGSNILPSAGYYRINVNTADPADDPNGMTYTMTPTTWAVIGNGTPGGWDADTPLTYNQETKKWEGVVTLTTMSAPNDGMKFRANGAWTINLGDTGADGSLEYDGTNISTTAGTYLIQLDLSNPRQYTYTMTLQN